MSWYFTSDLHFSHKNLILGTSEWSDKSRCRPFNTIEDHDNTLIENINSIVNENDILIHAGDFAFGGKLNIPKFRNMIKCKNIYTCIGNHDQHLVDYYKSLFTDVQYRFNFYFGKQHVIVDHYSLNVWENNNKNSWMLFGHSHQSLDVSNCGKTLDIGAEGHNYKPWTFEQIKEYMDARPIVAKDHH